MKTKGDEILALQAAKAEAEEAAEAAKKASQRLQDLVDESQGKVGALQDMVQTLQVGPRKLLQPFVSRPILHGGKSGAKAFAFRARQRRRSWSTRM
jgi:hypothetical protein